jgi:SAM-dependent methyltransferase
VTQGNGGHSHQHGDGAPHAPMTEAAWDERYGSTDALWSGNPNPQLVAEAADLDPGSALDVGCGEGADAIWLAERGWHVSAVDFSSVALERAAALAAQAGAGIAERITWVHQDLTAWTPPAASFDLVSAQFMHLPRELREPLYRRLAEAVAPGGTLLVVGHHPSDMETTMPRPAARDRFFTAGDIAATLDRKGWEIVVDAKRARQATDPDGNAVTIHDTVLRARRRP